MPTETLEKRTIILESPFNRVRVGGAGRFRLKWGAAPSLTIVGDRQIVDKVAVRVLGQTLHIQLERDVYDLDKFSLSQITR